MVSFVPSSFGRKLFGGYRITPKECRISISLDHFVPKSNIQYICMFNHECAQRGGIVVGACMDGFLFGACCQVSSKLNSENTLITDAQNIFYNQFQQHHGQEQNENKEITKTEEKDAQNTGAIVLYNTTTTVSDHKELTSSMKTEPLQNDTKTMSFLSSGKINANKTVQMKFDVNSSAINTFDLPMTEIYIKSNQTTKPTHTSDNTFVPSTQEMQTTSKNSLILKEQYVLVPTISHNTVTEKMPANEESTSSSSITTHVEAIETIIQQLNNSNSGLAYSISENLPTPSYVNDISMNPSKVISNSSALALALVTADSNWIHPPSSAVVLSPETNIIDIKHKTVLENKRDELGILNKFGVAWNSSTEKTKITAEVSPTIPTTALTPLLTLLTAPSRNPSIISNTKAKLNEMNKNVESSSKIPLIFATDTVAPVQETKIVDKMSSTNQSLLVTQSSSIKTTFVPKTTSIKESNITTAITSIANKTSTKQISTYPTKLQSLTTGIDSPVTFFTKQPSKIKLIGNSAKIEDSKKESLLIDDDQSYVPNSLYIHFSEETTPSSTVITSNNIFEITQKQPVTKPIFTSYITGSTTSTPSYSSQSPLTIDNHYSTMPPLVITNIDNNNKLNTPVFSSTQPSKQMLNLSSQDYISDSTYPLSPIKINKPQLSSIYNSLQKPTFIRIQSTVRPITPTILITPKPTILNTVSGGFQYHTTPLNTGYDDSNVNDKNTNVGVSSSYIFNKLVTKPPNKIVQENFKNTSHSFNKYNQFDYYESDSNYDKPSLQSVQSSYASSPSTYLNYPNNDEIASYITYLDNKTPNLDYYGPTPSYPAFHITDSDKVNTLSEEEESYVSVNDFVNFPPVRNPNLNMSATSSAVTSYVDISTPAFVEDSILNNKMDSLVSKIFESLQDTFQSLVDMIGERNITAQPVKLANSDNNAKPNKTNAQRPYIKKTTTSSQIKTTISPTTRRTETANKLTTKSSIKKSSINTTRRTPITTSKKPATRRTTTTTRPPINRKTTKRTTITTSTTKYTNVPSIELNNVNDEIESSDTNSQQYDNEIADIDEGAELNEGEVGRKFRKYSLRNKKSSSLHMNKMDRSKYEILFSSQYLQLNTTFIHFNIHTHIPTYITNKSTTLLNHNQSTSLIVHLIYL